MENGERPEDVVARMQETMNALASVTIEGTTSASGSGMRHTSWSVYGQFARYADEGYEESYQRSELQSNGRYTETIVANGRVFTRESGLPPFVDTMVQDWERGDDVDVGQLINDNLPEGIVVQSGELLGGNTYLIRGQGEIDGGQGSIQLYIDRTTMRLERYVASAQVSRGGESGSVTLSVDFSRYNETTVTRSAECTSDDCTPPLMYDTDSFSRDCDDFPTWIDAYRFLRAAYESDSDRHDLDVDERGSPCNGLPGAPGEGEPLPEL
jgi:hypothetical protein